MSNPLFARKSVDQLRSDAEHATGLKRTLTATDLVMLGIGAIIGTGIFVLTGRAAAVNAGPAVALSFILAGTASVFAGLCYAEMASMIPISGSAYTYAYATMGELVAWIIGWDLILEYLVAAAAVSVGWSGYVVAFLQHAFGFAINPQWTNAPVTWVPDANALMGGHFASTGNIINAPAALVVLAVTVILVIGIKESARFNTFIVFIKVAVVLAFIAFAASFVKTENWTPFIPPNEGTFGKFGISGVMQGAAMVFFAYIGFDAVSTAAQETKNPQRDLPIGILGSLAVCTVLYIAVSLILTGVVPYTQLNVPHPMSVGIAATGIKWMTFAVEIGAIAGLTSVMLVMLLGQPRIFFSMAVDGLFPKVATKIHPRFGTPYITTILTGIVCAVAGGMLPIDVLAELTSIGTLFAFVLVSLGVMILRRRRPEIPRAFRVPGGDYLVPLLGAGFSALLMYSATTHTIIRLFAWLALGMVFYYFYGRKHSTLRKQNMRGAPVTPPPRLALIRGERPDMLASLLRRKSPSVALADAAVPAAALKRTLSATDLAMLGIGAIVGAGIFSSTGQMAAGSPDHPGAGPALIVSYVLTAVVCGFAALCYAEIAAMVPVAGSAYTYAYVALGEVFAWIIGWDLIIEYAVGNIYVAQSWADYFRSFLRGAFGIDFPAWMATDLQTAARTPEIAAQAPHIGDFVVAFNLPAALITACITAVLIIGIKHSARVNTVMVVFKVALVLLFVGVGAFFIQPANYTPFAPNGFSGIWVGASLAFFSYIGFDAVSTAAEETRNPQRDMPRGIIWSLVICTVLYVATAAVITGLVPAAQLATGDPLAHALRSAGLDGMATLMALGAIIAVTAVLLVFQLGQTRIFMVMARDGLLPPALARVHPRFRTPATGSLLTGSIVAIAPTFITPSQALELTSIGTLFAFVVVSAGVIMLRVRDPGLPRPFRCPGYPVTPLLSIAFCLWLMIGLPWMNWVRFGGWLALGMIVYLVYGRRRSRLAAG